MKLPETFLNTYKTFADTLRMSDTVRTQMRESLIAYADLHPLPTAHAILSPVSLWARINGGVVRAGFALMLVLVGTGGVAFASEKSLPGDPLYTVKVALVEPLESSLLQHPRSKATWSAILAERRLTEAATLATRGALSAPTRTYLEEQFVLHAEEANRTTDEVEASGDVEAALAVRSDFEARLSAHADLFALLGADEENPEASKLEEVIVARRDLATAARMRTEEVAFSRALAYENSQIDAVAQATENVSRESREDGGHTEAVEDRIVAARGALVIARDALARDEDGGAYIATQAATRLTHEAEILSKNKDIILASEEGTPEAKQVPEEATSTPETEEESAEEPSFKLEFGPLNFGN